MPPPLVLPPAPPLNPVLPPKLKPLPKPDLVLMKPCGADGGGPDGGGGVATAGAGGGSGGADGGGADGGGADGGGADGGDTGDVMPRKNSCADIRAEPPTTLPPPVTSTLPLGSKVAVWA